jgi:glycosyltransferase involved in cell wall biosynthesis
MGRTVLINAGPWLPVPPVGYGGIEHVIACLVPELRRRGHRVVLATVGESTIDADEKLWVYPRGQFERLAAPYGQVMGVVHAHMQRVLERIDRPRAGLAIDLVHDHLEVVGPSMLAALGSKLPPVLHTLHWDLGKHPEFYSRFDGGGRVLFNGLSRQQLEDAPPRLRAQTLGTIPLGVDPGAYTFHADKQPYFVTLGRFTRVKGQDVAARLCKELGLELRMAGPVAAKRTPEELFDELDCPQSSLSTYADVRYYLDEVRTYEDGERIRWVGSVSGRAKQELVGRACALLAPVRWTEPGATAAVEALACGTPVIAMRRGAFAAIVEHGVTGFLADDERELADYLWRAGEIDPAACRRAVEERFSAAIMASAYDSFYERLIAPAGGRTVPPRTPPG